MPSDPLDLDALERDIAYAMEVCGNKLGQDICHKANRLLAECRRLREQVDELEVTLDDEQAAHQGTLLMLQTQRLLESAPNSGEPPKPTPEDEQKAKWIKENW